MSPLSSCRVISAVALISVTGLLCVACSAEAPVEPVVLHDLGREAPEPDSLGYIARMERDLIAEGTARSVVGTETLYFTELGEPGPTAEPENVSDLLVEVDHVLVDALGRIGSPPTFTYRITTGNSYPVIGQKYLFMASFNDSEPGTTYSSWFTAHDMIIADTTPVQYADGVEVPYATGMTYAEFIEALEDELE